MQALERLDLLVELGEDMGVPPVAAVQRRLGLDRIPADVDANEVRAEGRRGGGERGLAGRHVDAAQEHRLAVLVDELAAARW